MVERRVSSNVEDVRDPVIAALGRFYGAPQYEGFSDVPEGDVAQEWSRYGVATHGGKYIDPTILDLAARDPEIRDLLSEITGKTILTGREPVTPEPKIYQEVRKALDALEEPQVNIHSLKTGLNTMNRAPNMGPAMSPVNTNYLPDDQNAKGNVGTSANLMGGADTSKLQTISSEEQMAVRATAAGIGINPDDLMKVMLNEMAVPVPKKEESGSVPPIMFDPNVKNPDSSAQGAIQFIDDNWGWTGYKPGMSFLDQVKPGGPVDVYLREAGVKEGMGFEQIYRAIHAGSPTGEVVDASGVSTSSLVRQADKKWGGLDPEYLYAYDPLSGKRYLPPLNYTGPTVERNKISGAPQVAGLPTPRMRPGEGTQLTEEQFGPEPAMLPGGERLPPEPERRVPPTTTPRIVQQVLRPGPTVIPQADLERAGEELAQQRILDTGYLGDRETELSLQRPFAEPGRVVVGGKPEAPIGSMPRKELDVTPRLRPVNPAPEQAHPPVGGPIRMKVTGTGGQPEGTSITKPAIPLMKEPPPPFVVGPPEGTPVGRLPVMRPPQAGAAHPPVGLPIKMPVTATSGLGVKGTATMGTALGAMVPTPRERPFSEIDTLTMGLSNVEGTPGVIVRPRPDDLNRVQITPEKPLAGVPETAPFPSATNMRSGFLGPDPSGIEKDWSYKGTPIQARPGLNSVGYVGSGPLGFDDVAGMAAETGYPAAPSYPFEGPGAPQYREHIDLMPEVPPVPETREIKPEPVPEPEPPPEPDVTVAPIVPRKPSVIPNIRISLPRTTHPVTTSETGYVAPSGIPTSMVGRLAPAANVATTGVKAGSQDIATSPSGGPSGNYQLSTDSTGKTVISWQGSQGQTIHAYQDSTYGTGPIHGLDQQSGGIY